MYEGGHFVLHEYCERGEGKRGLPGCCLREEKLVLQVEDQEADGEVGCAALSGGQVQLPLLGQPPERAGNGQETCARTGAGAGLSLQCAHGAAGDNDKIDAKGAECQFEGKDRAEIEEQEQEGGEVHRVGLGCSCGFEDFEHSCNFLIVINFFAVSSIVGLGYK